MTSETEAKIEVIKSCNVGKRVCMCKTGHWISINRQL